MIKAYPKIFALGTRNVKDIFDTPVQVTEKVDGSQFVFGKGMDGELYVRSKGADIYIENPQKMFQQGVDHVVSIADRLREDRIYYCEYLQKPKHNTLTYDAVPKNHLCLFGIANTHRDEFWFDRASLEVQAEFLGIDAVPIIYEGMTNGEEIIAMVKDTESYLGGTNIEGAVVKANKQILVADQLYPVQTGKYVTDEFKEVHQGSWKKENTGKGKWDTYKDLFCTEARWNKAIQHLKEVGQLEDDPRDIGKLIKEIQVDIVKEEEESIKAYLWKTFSSELLRNATRGFPEFYKQKLILE